MIWVLGVVWHLIGQNDGICLKQTVVQMINEDLS